MALKDTLGLSVKDQVSGFKGTITAVAEQLEGCQRAEVTPPVDKDGKHREPRWFDVRRLECLDDVIRLRPDKSGRRHGQALGLHEILES